MSKGLEALKYLRECLEQRYYKEQLDTIENELKALEIIKETRVDVGLIKLSKDYDDYCSLEVIKILSVGEDMVVKQRGITKEEYDLLKEVLNG